VTIEQYDVPYNELEQSIMNWVTESLELRHGAGGDPEGKLGSFNPNDGVRDLVFYLQRVTKRADRVAELLAKATMARGRFRRARDEATFTADIAYDEATQRNKSVRGIDNFTSREERNADAMLASLNEKRAAHEAKRLVSIAEEAYEVISQVHWQLDSMKKDVRSSIHAVQFESNLGN
jgi:hypothetical protein